MFARALSFSPLLLPQTTPAPPLSFDPLSPWKYVDGVDSVYARLRVRSAARVLCLANERAFCPPLHPSGFLPRTPLLALPPPFRMTVLSLFSPGVPAQPAPTCLSVLSYYVLPGRGSCRLSLPLSSNLPLTSLFHPPRSATSLSRSYRTLWPRPLPPSIPSSLCHPLRVFTTRTTLPRVDETTPTRAASSRFREYISN